LLRSRASILTLRRLIRSASGLFRSRLGNAALELSFVFTRRLRCLGSDWSRARLSGRWWAGFHPSSSWPPPLLPSGRTTLDVWRSRFRRRCYRRAGHPGLRSFAGPTFTFVFFKRRGRRCRGARSRWAGASGWWSPGGSAFSSARFKWRSGSRWRRRSNTSGRCGRCSQGAGTAWPFPSFRSRNRSRCPRRSNASWGSRWRNSAGDLARRGCGSRRWNVLRILGLNFLL
jgi:hypothetical protein